MVDVESDGIHVGVVIIMIYYFISSGTSAGLLDITD